MVQRKEKGKELKSRLNLLLILLGFFLLVFIYAHMHIKTLNLGYRYILLQNKKLQLQNKNFQLRKELGEAMNLAEIDRKSSTELGLIYPDSKNIYIIRVPRTIDQEQEKPPKFGKETFQTLLNK